MKKFAARALMVLLIMLAVSYVLDYAVWRARTARGSGMGTVAVDQYLSTPLKGNKAEYDFMGTVQQPCARSLFPHGGAQPCWWLSRHTSQWE